MTSCLYHVGIIKEISHVTNFVTSFSTRVKKSKYKDRLRLIDPCQCQSVRTIYIPHNQFLLLIYDQCVNYVNRAVKIYVYHCTRYILHQQKLTMIYSNWRSKMTAFLITTQPILSAEFECDQSHVYMHVDVIFFFQSI